MTHFVSVKDFGALGDGVTDDSAAFQATHDSFNGKHGGTIFLPRGRYVINTPLQIKNINTKIVGTGRRNIQTPSNAYNGGNDVHSTVVIPANSSFSVIKATFDNNGFEARDFTVIGPSSGTKALYCFDFDKSGGTFRRDYLFERVSVQRFSKAFYFHNTVGSGDSAWGMVKIIDSSIMHNDRITDWANAVQVNHFVFENNEAGNNGYNPGVGGIRIQAHAASIRNNILEGTRDPVEVDNSYKGVIVANNYFEANTGSFLVKLLACRGVQIGPNSNQGVHVNLDQTYVLDQCTDVTRISDSVHPKSIHLSPESVISNANPGIFPEKLLAGSTSPWELVTSPDERFSRVPPTATSVLSAHPDSVVGSCPDPFLDGHFMKGYSQADGTTKTFTFTNAQIAFAANAWVVATCMIKRDGTPASDEIRSSININGVAGVNGSWTGFWPNAYRQFSNDGIWVFCRATKAQVASAVSGTTLTVVIRPYGNSGITPPLPWSMSPLSVYVVDNPNKILPWLPWGPRHTASAPPTGGAWVVGDKLYDSAPAAAGTVGWVCTTAGTPGTWKTFGAIAA